jgi:hypothetical protein
MEGDLMAFELLEHLRKLAHVLVCPLFVVAYMNDHQMLRDDYRLNVEGTLRVFDSTVLGWMLKSEDIRFQVIGWGVVLGILLGLAIFGV